MRWFSVLLCIVVVSSTLAADADGIAFFEKKIRPVLVDSCYSCHSAEAKKANKLKGGLYLDTKEGLLKGGDTGPSLVVGKPNESLLIKGLLHSDELRMPPKGKLPENVIVDFKKWIEMGAPDPRDGKIVTARVIDIEEGRKFWAFQPPRANTKLTSIDVFLDEKRQAGGVKVVQPATKRELVRRVTFDLLGLPPTPEEMDTALKDQSPEWYEKVVDRLLSSPQYGERWARYWLDVARFAEDQAHTFGVKPFTQAFRFRDWVIKAFNDDMPYDRFIKLQLAGDLMKEDTMTPFDQLAGLGFNGLGVSYYKNTAALQATADELDDRIDTLTRGFLGLTVSCARCHDHKFDPIPTKDYYALAGIYNGSNLQTKPLVSPAEADRFAKAQQAVKSKEDAVKKWLDEAAKKANKKTIPKDQEAKLLTAEQQKVIAAMRAEMDALKKALPPAPPEVHVILGGGKQMPIYIRGNPLQPGEPAPKGFLQVLTPKDATKASDYGRLELANAIASRDNPLTARVFVNRVWQHHFGRGIVGTPSNFGMLGERPSHPELLDWLAIRFMDNGWSIKKLHRDMVLSRTYQLSSGSDARNREIDADNRLLWRMNRQRLDIEAYRDALLAVSGKLDRTMGGPPLDLSNRANVRRTVYARISRHRLDATLALFDFPDPNVTSDSRTSTTVPQQQLYVLNSDFVLDQARAFAKKLETIATEDKQRIAIAYEIAFGRPATTEEVQLGIEFLQVPLGKDDKLSKWEQYAQALLGSNEFLYVD